jgi:hypothetical protein
MPASRLRRRYGGSAALPHARLSPAQYAVMLKLAEASTMHQNEWLAAGHAAVLSALVRRGYVARKILGDAPFDIATWITDAGAAAMGAYENAKVAKPVALSPVVRWETRAVLAGAYRGKGLDRSTLTHLVGIDAAGNDVRVKCRGVKIDSLADPYASDPDVAPTCPRCAGLAR